MILILCAHIIEPRVVEILKILLNRVGIHFVVTNDQVELC